MRNSKPTLVVMLKEPNPGRVKTRLGRDIGMTTAAWWFRHQSQRLLRELRSPLWDLALAVSPDKIGLTSRVWPSDLARIPQGHGNLGDRMRRILQLKQGSPICIIGSDIPSIKRHHINKAFRTLKRHDYVLGPAPDGGFWLIGANTATPISSRLFENVRWSSEYAMSDSVATAQGARWAYIDTLQDIDCIEDLQKHENPSPQVGNCVTFQTRCYINS